MYFNPDNIKFGEQKSILEDNIVLNKLVDKMEKKLSNYRPNPDDFREIYGDTSVDLDLKYTKKLEEKWKLENREKKEPEIRFIERQKRQATITEAIMINQLSGGWLNVENSPYSVVAAPTSKPDDYGIINDSKKGFDLSLEFINNDENESSLDTYAGASIDITTSKDSDIVHKKISKIVNLIKRGETPIIKYFENDSETFKGSIDVAPFILVLSERTIKDLFEKEYSGDKKGLENHSVQLSLLQQLKEQSETFLVLSKKYNNQILTDSYKQTLDHINYLLLKKRDYHNSFNISIDNLDEKYNGLKLLHKAVLDSIL